MYSFLDLLKTDLTSTDSVNIVDPDPQGYVIFCFDHLDSDP
jgi:hypothetical protein